MTYWPAEWCVSFKHTLMPRWPMNFVKVPPLPPETRVVCFTGLPNPDHARDGVWPSKRRMVEGRSTSTSARRRGSPSIGVERRAAKGGRMTPMRVLILSDGVAGHDRSSLGILTALQTPQRGGARASNPRDATLSRP